MYRFKLYDEDDPLAELAGGGYAPDYDTSSPPMGMQLEAPPDSLESLLSPDAGPYGPSYRPTQLPGQDRELEDAYRARELAALRSSSDQGYGWAEGIRDVAPAAIGLLVDGIANKGRGAANIVGVTAQQAASNQAYDRAQKQKEAELAVRLHQRNGSRFLDPYAQEKLDLANRRLGATLSGQAGVQARDDRKVERQDNYDSEHNETQRRQTRAKATEAELGRSEGETQTNPQDAQNAANIAGARTTATTNAGNDAERTNPPPISPVEQQRLDAEKQRLAMEARRLQLQEEGIGYERERRAGEKRIEHGKAYRKELGEALSIAKSARALQGVFERNPESIPGSGPILTSKYFPDALLSDDAIEAQNLFAEFANPTFKDRAGSAVSASEAERVKKEVGNLGSTNDKVVRTAVKNINDLMRARIRAASKGRQDVAREALEEYGLADILDDMEPDAPAQTAAPTAAPLPPAKLPGSGWRQDNYSDFAPDQNQLPVQDDWRERYKQWRVRTQGGTR